MPTTPDAKTILFVHNSNDFYGAEVILLNLIKALDRSRFKALVALPEDARHINRLSVRLQQEGIPYVFLPLGIMRRKYLAPRKILRYIFELATGTVGLCSLIRKNKVDLVHSNTLAVLSGAFASAITRRPHVWHIHEFLSVNPKLRKFLHWTSVRFSQKIVTVSNAVREHILKDQPAAHGKIQTIYNGVDLAPYGSKSGRLEVRQELGIPPEATVIGMVGRVSRWKGQSVFVEAARLVLAQRPHLYFVAVGGVFDDEHHYMEAFRALVSGYNLENFIISDFRQDIPAVLASYDVFVLPSIEPDPFPTVIVESMASGLPVIGAAHGGVPEMIIDKLTGLLVKPGSSEELSAAVLAITGDQRILNDMGRASRQSALSRFQVGRFAEEFQTVYSSLLISGT